MAVALWLVSQPANGVGALTLAGGVGRGTLAEPAGLDDGVKRLEVSQWQSEPSGGVLG